VPLILEAGIVPFSLHSILHFSLHYWHYFFWETWLHRKYKKTIEENRLFYKILLIMALRCRLRHAVTQCMWVTCWETV